AMAPEAKSGEGNFEWFSASLLKAEKPGSSPGFRVFGQSIGLAVITVTRLLADNNDARLHAALDLETASDCLVMVVAVWPYTCFDTTAVQVASVAPHARLHARLDFHTRSSPFRLFRFLNDAALSASGPAISAVHLYRRKREDGSIT